MFNTIAALPTLRSCTFRGNTARDVGGGIYSNFSSSPTLANCILWVNNPNQITDASGAVTTVTYSDVQGGWTGIGNIDADPLFVDTDGPHNIIGIQDDDLRLSAGSPAIDAADNTAMPPGVTTDLDGNARLADELSVADTGNGTAPIIDMGAFERQP